MTPIHRKNTEFLRQFTLCQIRDDKFRVVGPAHLHRTWPGLRPWTSGGRMERPICGQLSAVGTLPDLYLLPVDIAHKFDPARDLDAICPACAAEYRRLARAHAGLPAEGRLTF